MGLSGDRLVPTNFQALTSQAHTTQPDFSALSGLGEVGVVPVFLAGVWFSLQSCLHCRVQESKEPIRQEKELTSTAQRTFRNGCLNYQHCFNNLQGKQMLSTQDTDTSPTNPWGYVHRKPSPGVLPNGEHQATSCGDLLAARANKIKTPDT